MSALQTVIESAFEKISEINPSNASAELRDAVNQVLDQLDRGEIRVAEKIDYSIVIGSRGEKFAWNCTRFDQLTAEHFALLASLKPELVIFGSGTRLQFPPPLFLQGLMAQRIGLETMDTLAACRTYNILAGEGRKVAAAFILEG